MSGSLKRAPSSQDPEPLSRKKIKRVSFSDSVKLFDSGRTEQRVSGVLVWRDLVEQALRGSENNAGDWAKVHDVLNSESKRDEILSLIFEASKQQLPKIWREFSELNIENEADHLKPHLYDFVNHEGVNIVFKQLAVFDALLYLTQKYPEKQKALETSFSEDDVFKEIFKTSFNDIFHSVLSKRKSEGFSVQQYIADEKAFSSSDSKKNTSLALVDFRARCDEILINGEASETIENVLSQVSVLQAAMTIMKMGMGEKSRKS